MKRTGKMSKVIFGCLLGLTLVFVSAHQALAQGTWETSEPPTPTLTPMPTARCCLGLGVIDGELYVMGGSSSILEVYDPAADTWDSSSFGGSTLLPMPGLPPALLAAAAIGDKFYVVGGCDIFDCGGKTTGRLEVYDSTTPGWTTLTSMPTPRHSMAAGAIDGKLYVVGGGTSVCCPALDILQVFDPNDGALGSWSTLAPMPTPRRELAAAVIDGKLYVVGGRDGALNRLDTLEIYDPAFDTWESSEAPAGTLASMPAPLRDVLAAGVINGKLYVVGGNDGSTFLDTVRVYDPAANTWSTEAPMPTARQRLAAAGIGGKLYVVGGDGGLNAIEVFTPGPTPSEQIDNTLDFIEDSVNDGDLEGDGPGKSADNRLNALINMIEEAGALIDDGQIAEACDQLQAALKKTDGQPKPPDFVTGDAALELAEIIQDIRSSLACE